MSYKSHKHQTINNIIFKQCNCCNEWLELNSTYFSKQPSKKNGYCDLCRICQDICNHIKYLNNQEEYKKYSYDYYWGNRGVVLPKQIAYKHRVKDHVSDYNSKYFEEHKESEYERTRSWRQSEIGKELSKLSSMFRREHKMHDISDEEWIACKEYFKNEYGEYCCAYCGKLLKNHYMRYGEGVRYMDLHKEHFRHDGSNGLDNCVPSCQSCNSSKGTKLFENWYTPKKKRFDEERLLKILKWINGDYELYLDKELISVLA